MKRVLSATTDYACSDCAGLAFSSQRRLEEHRANVHGEVLA
jgi:hypothetical protein